MARKTTKSQRSGTRRSQSASSRDGKGNTRTWDRKRPALEARRQANDTDVEYRRYVQHEEQDPAGPPDVLLDVPELKIDSIHLELDDLVAHVAAKANVLNLVKLTVGIDVQLSRVKLDVKGIEAQVVLKARLDHVTAIVDRLMTSLDRNPELVKGLSRAVSEIGQGAGEAVDETGDAAKDIGKGAQGALKDVGRGAGQATADIGEGAGQAVGNVDQVVGGVGQTVGQATQGLDGALQQVQQNGQPNGGAPQGAKPGTLAKELARTVVREIGHAASDEAKDVGIAATRKVRELGERRDQRRAHKHNATEAAVRIAHELHIDLADVDGTGSGGRVTVRDVRESVKA